MDRSEIRRLRYVLTSRGEYWDLNWGIAELQAACQTQARRKPDFGFSYPQLKTVVASIPADCLTVLVRIEVVSVSEASTGFGPNDLCISLVRGDPLSLDDFSVLAEVDKSDQIKFLVPPGDIDKDGLVVWIRLPLLSFEMAFPLKEVILSGEEGPLRQVSLWSRRKAAGTASIRVKASVHASIGEGLSWGELVGKRRAGVSAAGLEGTVAGGGMIPGAIANGMGPVSGAMATGADIPGSGGPGNFSSQATITLKQELAPPDPPPPAALSEVQKPVPFPKLMELPKTTLPPPYPPAHLVPPLLILRRERLLARIEELRRDNSRLAGIRGQVFAGSGGVKEGGGVDVGVGVEDAVPKIPDIPESVPPIDAIDRLQESPKPYPVLVPISRSQETSRLPSRPVSKPPTNPPSRANSSVFTPESVLVDRSPPSEVSMQ